MTVLHVPPFRRFAFVRPMRRALILSVLVLGALWAAPASAQPCTGLCLQQVTCPSGPNGGTTSLSGRVFAPNGVDPLPNVLVYVPNSPVLPFESGAVCTAGGQQASGSPLVETTTAVDGTFRLTNMPVGSNIPVVIQAGKWRRQFVVPNVQACASTSVSSNLSRFPRNRTEGDIPKIAIVTGAVDAIECALRKIGIQDSEFGNPGSTSRIQIYKGSGNAGAIVNNSTPNESQLFASQSNLNQYDMTMLACQGNQFDRTPAERQRLLNYANAGGRVFATHFEYSWLYNTAPFSGTANWDVKQPNIPDQNALVNTSFPKGAQLAQWLRVVGASPAAGVIPLQAIRHDQNGVIPPTQSWLSVNDPVAGSQSVQFTFNTPVGVPADQQCGRVLFNEYHVENVNDSSLMQFPTACSAGPMTAQEKLLEYMLFDLSTFVAPDIPATVSVSFTNAPPTFTQGDAADQTVINVTNTKPTLATDATLTLTAAIPNGLTTVSMAGLDPATTRWACTVATTSCTRTTPLAGGATDPISLILAVAPNAPVGSGPVVLTATASGGGLAANVVADNPITIRGLATLAWAGPAVITYGTGLDGTQLNAQGNVPGTYVYSPPAGTVLNAGTHPLNVTFTPNDTINYPNSPTATVQIEVDRATPSLTWTPPSPIVYPTPLSATQLSASALVDGTFSYSQVTGAVLNAGSQPLNVTFTPTDTTNYAGASAGVTLVVNQATPSLTWATPSPIVYGTPLSATQLSASADVPGAFSYLPPAGTVLNAGANQPLEVRFAPTDSVNYKTVSANVSVNVVASPAVINGMPLGASCSIWPPNGKLVQVATIGASATAGGVQSFSVTATSNEPVGSGDIVIAGLGVGPRTVQLRAARAGKNSGRIYTITATATNIAGAVTTATTTCTVPHDQSR